MFKRFSLSKFILYVQSGSLSQVLLIMGLIGTYLSVYAVAIAPYDLENPGMFRWGQVTALDVFMGVSVTALQSISFLVFINSRLLLSAWQKGMERAKSFNDIPDLFARFIILAAAAFAVAWLAHSMIFGSYVANWSAVNDYLGITGSTNVSPGTRVLQGIILGGTELLLDLSLKASIVSEMKASEYEDLRRTAIGTGARANAGARPPIPAPPSDR